MLAAPLDGAPPSHPRCPGWWELFDGKTLGGWQPIIEADIAGIPGVALKGRKIYLDGQVPARRGFLPRSPCGSITTSWRSRPGIQQTVSTLHIDFRSGDRDGRWGIGSDYGRKAGLAVVDGKESFTDYECTPDRWYTIRLRLAERDENGEVRYWLATIAGIVKLPAPAMEAIAFLLDLPA